MMQLWSWMLCPEGKLGIHEQCASPDAYAYVEKVRKYRKLLVVVLLRQRLQGLIVCLGVLRAVRVRRQRRQKLGQGGRQRRRRDFCVGSDRGRRSTEQKIYFQPVATWTDCILPAVNNPRRQRATRRKQLGTSRLFQLQERRALSVPRMETGRALRFCSQRIRMKTTSRQG